METRKDCEIQETRDRGGGEGEGRKVTDGKSGLGDPTSGDRECRELQKEAQIPGLSRKVIRGDISEIFCSVPICRLRL